MKVVELSKQFDLRSMRPQKAVFEDVLNFAELSLDDPEVVSVLKKQASEPPVLDEEFEHLQMILLMKADKYVKSRGLSWKLRSGYKEGFAITAALLEGTLESISDPRAHEILKHSRLIDFPEADKK